MSNNQINNDNSNNLHNLHNFSYEIEKYYTSTRPYSEEIIEKEKLCKYIIECGEYLQRKCEKEVKQNKRMKCKNREKSEFLYNMSKSEIYFDKWDIFTFGSESWGTSCRDSDIDMGIFVNFKNMRPDKKYLLSELAKIIGENDNDGLLLIKPILNARYPIIRITQNRLNIKIDVSIADRFCKSRDQLILRIINRFEQKYKIPIKKLIVFIKYWSKQKKINNSYQCFLNSFGYTLLTIKFLQYYINTNTNTNKLLSHLVYKFFEFYHKKYNSDLHLISINDNILNQNSFLPKQFNKEINGYYLMDIRDPVNFRNNIAQRIGWYQLQRIKQEFKYAYHITKSNNKNIFQLLTQQPSSILNIQPIIIIQKDKNYSYLNQFYDEQQDQNWRDSLYDNYSNKSNNSNKSLSTSTSISISTSPSISNQSDKSDNNNNNNNSNSNNNKEKQRVLDINNINIDDFYNYDKYYYDNKSNDNIQYYKSPFNNNRKERKYNYNSNHNNQHTTRYNRYWHC